MISAESLIEKSISTDMSACVQVSRTQLDWLVGMSHMRFSVPIRKARGLLPD